MCLFPFLLSLETMFNGSMARSLPPTSTNGGGDARASYMCVFQCIMLMITIHVEGRGVRFVTEHCLGEHALGAELLDPDQRHEHPLNRVEC